MYNKFLDKMTIQNMNDSNQNEIAIDTSGDVTVRKSSL